MKNEWVILLFDLRLCSFSHFKKQLDGLLVKLQSDAFKINKKKFDKLFVFSEKATTTSLKGQDDYSLEDGNINYANFNDDYYDSGPYPPYQQVIIVLVLILKQNIFS